jgi:hypothetical protein
MAQSLELNIKTTSDVPQAMDKAKSATVSFGKQVEDIQKKFSTAFKDIALGFVAPMILLQSAINFISAAIEKRKQDIKEAYDFALKAESKYLDSETVVLAKTRAAKEQDEKEREMAKTAKLTEYTKFLEQPGMRDKVADEIGGFRGFRIKYGLDANSAEAMAKNADVQAVINRMIAPAVEASKKAAEISNTPKAASFKGPDGISNVIGVGLSPGMVILNEQLRLQQEIADNVRAMAAKTTDAGEIDFTKYTGKNKYSAPLYPQFK